MITISKTKIDKDEDSVRVEDKDSVRVKDKDNLGLSEVEVGSNLCSFWQSQVLGLLEPRTAELIEPTLNTKLSYLKL